MIFISLNWYSLTKRSCQLDWLRFKSSHQKRTLLLFELRIRVCLIQACPKFKLVCPKFHHVALRRGWSQALYKCYFWNFKTNYQLLYDWSSFLHEICIHLTFAIRMILSCKPWLSRVTPYVILLPRIRTNHWNISHQKQCQSIYISLFNSFGLYLKNVSPRKKIEFSSLVFVDTSCPSTAILDIYILCQCLFARNRQDYNHIKM